MSRPPREGMSTGATPADGGGGATPVRVQSATPGIAATYVPIIYIILVHIICLSLNMYASCSTMALLKSAKHSISAGLRATTSNFRYATVHVYAYATCHLCLTVLLTIYTGCAMQGAD